MPGKKRRPRRSKTRRRKGNRPGSRAGTPIYLTTNPDGAPFDGDCACPVCVDLARQNIPQYTLDSRGDLVEVQPLIPDMIDVTVHGTASTWPHLPIEGRTVSVPVGAIVGDLLEYLKFLDQDFQIAFPPGTLTAHIDGRPCEPDRVVRPGDVLSVTGFSDPELSRLWASIFARD